MSAIEWTDKTWNPIAGCRKVSPGCDNCYAITEARRKDGTIPKYLGTTMVEDGRVNWSGNFNFEAKALDIPRKVKTPTIWFVNSMSDLFGEGVTADQIERVFEVMNQTPHHTYQILTKRPNRMARMAQLRWTPNIWAGVSIEDDKYVFRARLLAKVPATLRFISAEPLLGDLPSLDLTGIGWVIVGGESGRSPDRIRPMDPQWARNILAKCRAAGIPFFFKQWGNHDENGVWHRSKKNAGHLLDGVEYFEMPPLVQKAMGAKASPMQAAAVPLLPAPAPAATATPSTTSGSVASYRTAILALLANGPMTGADLRAANGAQSARDVNLHAWALVRLQRDGEIAKRSDGRYGLKFRVPAATRAA